MSKINEAIKKAQIVMAISNTPMGRIMMDQVWRFRREEEEAVREKIKAKIMEQD